MCVDYCRGASASHQRSLLSADNSCVSQLAVLEKAVLLFDLQNVSPLQRFFLCAYKHRRCVACVSHSAAAKPSMLWWGKQ